MLHTVIKPDANEEARHTVRHQLTLRLPGRLNATPLELHAQNISQSGFLAETAAPVKLDDELILQMPELGECRARVVWKSGAHIGCDFEQPLPRGALSAAMLKATARAVPGSAASPANERLDLLPYLPATVEGAARTATRLPLRTRLWIIAAAATVPWLAIGGVLFLV